MIVEGLEELTEKNGNLLNTNAEKVCVEYIRAITFYGKYDKIIPYDIITIPYNLIKDNKPKMANAYRILEEGICGSTQISYRVYVKIQYYKAVVFKE